MDVAAAQKARLLLPEGAPLNSSFAWEALHMNGFGSGLCDN